MKLSEMMRERTLLSFEFFPPKTDAGMERLADTVRHLMMYRPDFISCTYGAGGTNAGRNLEVCRMILDAGATPMTHFTVIRNTREGIKEQMDRYLACGVDHVLALRGDIPSGERTTGGDFRYATDLVKYIRDTYGERFEIAVAGSPEGHICSRSVEADVAFLKQKQDNGADYVMTQLCWDMDRFAGWLDMIRRAGVTMPVVVGVMPVLDIRSTINMTLSRNGCVMDAELARLISRYWIFPDPFDSNPPFEDKERERKMADFTKAGIEYTIRQIDRYRSMGVEGIHIYALNRWEHVSEIVDRAGIRTIV